MSSFDPYEHLNITLNPDGTLTRLVHLPEVQATGDDEPAPGESFVCKDVTLNADNKTWARIFRPTKIPSNDNCIARLPILIYFHTGGWIQLSPSTINVHTKCSEMASELPAIVVAVAYRLAPEHRIPAPYEDAIDAITWVKQQVVEPEGEKWLKDYADFSRCFLSGSGCGGNIAFNAALRAEDLDLKPLNIAGVVMNQPMFTGQRRTKSEVRQAADPLLPLPVVDLLWELALPRGTDRDLRYSNPMIEGPHWEKIRSLGRCLVVGFGGDLHIDRQQQFVHLLVKCGVQVEARFDDPGFHGIELIDPRRSALIINIIKDFIN